MRLGIIADIHANLEALQAVLSFLEGKTERLVVIGDVLGYGPNPKECLESLVRHPAVFVKGNHEAGVVSGELSRFHKEAGLALEWTRQRLDAAWLEKIDRWPEELVLAGGYFVHGSPDDRLFGYISTSRQAESAFSVLTNRLCFHGHTHFPAAFRKKVGSDTVETVPADFGGGLTVRIEPDYFYLIDAGSVGQPRDGLPSACAGVYDSEAALFQLTRLAYPAEITRDKIISTGLPSSLAGRLLRGL